MKLHNMLTIVMVLGTPTSLIAQNAIDYFEDPPEAPVIEQQADAIVPLLVESPAFFNMPEDENPIFDLSTQQTLLEKSNDLAVFIREIKEQGNEQAVLNILAAITNGSVTTDLFRQAFNTIEINRVAPVVINQPEVAVPEPVEEPVAAKVIHEIIPLFAQTYSENGGRDKAIVVIDGQRFIRLPGETIEVNNRTISIESITESLKNGRSVYTIWISENGVRSSLTW